MKETSNNWVASVPPPALTASMLYAPVAAVSAVPVALYQVSTEAVSSCPIQPWAMTTLCSRSTELTAAPD